MGTAKQVKNTMRILRGPHLEVWMLRPGKARPEITIRYGHPEDYQCQSFNDAYCKAYEILIANQMADLLRRYQRFNDGETEDYESLIEETELLLAQTKA